MLVLTVMLCAAVLCGIVATGALARRQFRRLDDAFRCRLRRPKPDRWWVTNRRTRRAARMWRRSRLRSWTRTRPRLTASAVWAHDVLVVHHGLVRPRVAVFRVRFPDGPIVPMTEDLIVGLGPYPVLFPLRCDDESPIEVAAAEEDLTLLAGPFLAAAIPGLPRAPRERWLRDR